jgi:putative transposase
MQSIRWGRVVLHGETAAAMRIVTRGTTRLHRQVRHLAVAQLSRDAKTRLKWMEHYQRHGRASLTARYFGISRQTFYTWKRRYDPQDLSSLESRSSQPKRVRRRTWTTEQILAVTAIRAQRPRWGKDKLVVLLREQGMWLSTSMVGRILRYLKDAGQLVEPIRAIGVRKRRTARPHATRKPRGYQATVPGDIVQVDTMELHPLPGMTFKHFTAHDVVSRYNVAALRSQATATSARAFLQQCLAEFPFPLRAIQVDGGSEFMAEFEEACAQASIQLFVLPPRSPKLNGGVERAHRTHREEFYECCWAEPTVAGYRPALAEWIATYNTVRPHQALGYLTPVAWLAKYSATHGDLKGAVSGTY